MKIFFCDTVAFIIVGLMEKVNATGETSDEDVTIQQVNTKKILTNRKPITGIHRFIRGIVELINGNMFINSKDIDEYYC